MARDRFGVDPRSLRLYVHYVYVQEPYLRPKHFPLAIFQRRSIPIGRPSYFHLHIHVTHASLDDAPGVFAGRAHLLDDVMQNMAFKSDYYQAVCGRWIALAPNDSLRRSLLT